MAVLGVRVVGGGAIILPTSTNVYFTNLSRKLKACAFTDNFISIYKYGLLKAVTCRANFNFKALG